MAGLAAVARLRFVFKDDYFIAPAVFLRRGQHPGAFDDGFAAGDIIAIGDEQHPVQFDSAARFYREKLDVYRLAFSYFILFAACFNYRVNFGPRLSIE